MYAEATKVCRACGLERPISAFGKAATNRDGLNTRCKDCINRRERLPENRDARREYHRNYQRERRRNNPDVRIRLANQDAARKYGISEDEVRELRSCTHCQCCGVEFKDDPNHRHIDHCHESGDVRGIICRTCNHTIQGTHAECMYRLKLCLHYLERHRPEIPL
jgi:hypothetical protein